MKSFLVHKQASETINQNKSSAQILKIIDPYRQGKVQDNQEDKMMEQDMLKEINEAQKYINVLNNDLSYICTTKKKVAHYLENNVPLEVTVSNFENETFRVDIPFYNNQDEFKNTFPLRFKLTNMTNEIIQDLQIFLSMDTAWPD